MYTIITKNQCNFCDTAKALLTGADKQFRVINVQDPEKKWVLTLLKQAGYTTVPQIIDPDGKLIGGYTELKEYFNVTSST
jgi:glutaredoxin